MRWLALLFVIMAFGCLLEWTEYEGMEGIRNRDEASDMWYWAARRAIMGSPTFHGVSFSLYLGCRRPSFEARSRPDLERRALLLCASQESLDIVRATILVTFYLVNQRRAPEGQFMLFTSLRGAESLTSSRLSSLASHLLRRSLRTSSGTSHRWWEVEPLATRGRDPSEVVGSGEWLSASRSRWTR